MPRYQLYLHRQNLPRGPKDADATGQIVNGAFRVTVNWGSVSPGSHYDFMQGNNPQGRRQCERIETRQIGKNKFKVVAANFA